MKTTGRVLGIAFVLALTAIPAGTAHAATPCIPSVYGSGPTVTVTPDYSHPANSEVDYDSSAFEIGVNPCFP